MKFSMSQEPCQPCFKRVLPFTKPASLVSIEKLPNDFNLKPISKALVADAKRSSLDRVGVFFHKFFPM